MEAKCHPKRPKWHQKVPEGVEMEPKESQRGPKREPKGAKREQKKSQKGAFGNPAQDDRPSERGPYDSARVKGGTKWSMITASDRLLACVPSPGSLTMNG